MYSYGSGLAATFFSIKVKGSTEEIKKNLQLNERLEKNQVRSCEEFLKALEVRSIFIIESLRLMGVSESVQYREHKHNISDYTPDGSIDDIAPGAYYLAHCDSKHRRVYKVRGEEGKEVVENGKEGVAIA